MNYYNHGMSGALTAIARKVLSIGSQLPPRVSCQQNNPVRKYLLRKQRCLASVLGQLEAILSLSLRLFSVTGCMGCAGSEQEGQSEQ